VPVTVRDVSEDELSEIALRKPPAVNGTIRVILVDDYDASACGGTHVGATGEIGLIKIVDTERYKGGVRVGFLCGGRALRDFQSTRDLLRLASGLLSVGFEELPDAVGRLDESLREAQRELRQVRAELQDYDAERLWREARDVNDLHVVVAHWSDRSFADVRAIALNLRERPKTVALLAAAEGKGVRIVCTRSEDVDGIDAGKLLREALKPLDGRGGGSPAVAQGGAAQHPSNAVRAALEQALLGQGLS
jgi:alanyl-tRNA synthetase